MAILDYEEEQTFTREQLEKMKVLNTGLRLTEWASGDGSDLVVDVLDGGKLWVQYDRKHRIYRCADKSRGPGAPYSRDWRAAK
jgi:hypothetical protein